MPKRKPLAGGPMSLRDATFKNETVKQREGYNLLSEVLSLTVCYSMSRN